MSIGTILLIILILALLGIIPVWPQSRSWGYGPSGGVGLIAYSSDPAFVGPNLINSLKSYHSPVKYHDL